MANKHFTIDAICNDIEQKNICGDSCPVSIDRLRILNVAYYDFLGIEHHDGQIIVLDAIAKVTLEIFQELHNLKFPITKIKLLSDYNGSDELSMADNNSSGFVNREITGGGRVSLHAYGVAIDINPVQNPYLKPQEDGVTLAPIAGAYFLNRSNVRPGMVEPIVEVFTKHGFIWGGVWNDPIDWMHFQLDRTLAEQLVAMGSEAAIEYFDNII